MEESQDELKKQLIEWSRRLQKLKEKKAKLGLSADPSVDIEIEDIEDEIAGIEKKLAEIEEIPEPIGVPSNKEVVQHASTREESQVFQGVSRDDLDVPLLKFSQEVDPKRGIHTNGIQFTDKAPDGRVGSPKLYLSVYFKESKYFVPYPFSTNEKWLYLEANMRPALNLRIQVSANMRDVVELMNFLQDRRDSWDMHGPRPADNLAGDYFYVWRENGENRLMISTFTATNAGISIHARFSSEVAKSFANYLEEVGFTKPFEE